MVAYTFINLLHTVVLSGCTTVPSTNEVGICLTKKNYENDEIDIIFINCNIVACIFLNPQSTISLAVTPYLRLPRLSRLYDSHDSNDSYDSMTITTLMTPTTLMAPTTPANLGTPMSTSATLRLCDFSYILCLCDKAFDLLTY